MNTQHLRRQEFTWEGQNRDGSPLSVKGVVREKLGSDVFRGHLIQIALPNDTTSYVATRFADFVILTDSVEGLPWWPTLDASSEVIATAFDCWEMLPANLVTRWWNAIDDVSKPMQNGSPAPVPEPVEDEEDPPNE